MVRRIGCRDHWPSIATWSVFRRQLRHSRPGVPLRTCCPAVCHDILNESIRALGHVLLAGPSSGIAYPGVIQIKSNLSVRGPSDRHRQWHRHADRPSTVRSLMCCWPLTPAVHTLLSFWPCSSEIATVWRPFEQFRDHSESGHRSRNPSGRVSALGIPSVYGRCELRCSTYKASSFRTVQTLSRVFK